MVSINELTNAFDDVLKLIDQIEETVESQTEIDLNEMKLAQLEKIVYVNSQLSIIEGYSKANSTYKAPLTLAVSR